MKQEKLEAILTTAKKMFARYGLRKTSLDEIARLARVAKGTIYNYFGSKDRVYMEVLRREADEIIKNISLAVDKVVSPQEKFVAFFRAKSQYLRQATTILDLDGEGVGTCMLSAESIRNDFFEQEVHLIDSILKEGIEKGVFRLNNASFAARSIGYALRGFECNRSGHENEEQIDHYRTGLLNLIFTGLLVGKSSGQR
ncbi:MAG: hypothetical protein DRJ08_01215 [Acidobacteria bacterium]|nr:MAG: hypothetical protein DRJ14_01605 [Acidobacteriota bacterium]RLE24239.1 MAG: hypothetical protein DRJ08_01215 [Acidobacteriota bacterium]